MPGADAGDERLPQPPLQLTFLSIVGTIAVVQVIITSVPGLTDVFEVKPLAWWEWLLILVCTASVLGFAEIMRQIRRSQQQTSPVLAPRPV